jgi:hypothetical protein
MYDTLLQMGRWFGYRDGYSDLTRIYLPPEAIGWYAHITKATSELRLEFERMEQLGMTPRDFGLKVRSDPETLLITARNKMREAREILWSIDLAGKLIETAKIADNAGQMEENRKALFDLVEQLDGEVKPYQKASGDQVVWSGVKRETVLAFLTRFRGHPSHLPSQKEAIVAYCSDPDVQKMEKWDVVLASSTLAGAKSLMVHGHQIGLQVRGTTREAVVPPALRVSGSSARVASRGLEKTGIDSGVVKQAEEKFLREHPGKKNVPDLVYREIRDRPLLMLHLFRLAIPNLEEHKEVIDDVAAWGISFPGVKGRGDHKLVSYKVNLVWWKEQHGDLMVEEEVEEEDADE